MDVGRACAQQTESGSRAVLVGDDEGGVWRCSVTDRVELGPPDWDEACVGRFGAGAIAFLLAHDSRGWRCADVENGIYSELELALDHACQLTFGVEAFGEEVGDAPEDLACYGALAA